MKQPRKFSKYFMLVLAGILISSLLLVACSAQQPEPAPIQEEQQAEEPVQEEAQPAEEAEPAEEEVAEEEDVAQDDGVTEEVLGSGEIEINYWHGLSGPDGVIMVELVEQFVEENPDVTVKMQVMPWGNYFDKIAAALVAGSGGPDLMIFWHSIVPQYALSGHLLPIGDLMFDAGMLERDDFSPQLIDSVSFDGEVYTIPFDNYGVGIYVNVELLERAGISPDDPPQNQEEFLDYARRLTWDENGNNPGDEGFDPENVEVWGFSTDWVRATIQPALYQWGADVISDDPDPEVLINSPGAIEAVQFFVDLIHEYNVAPPSATTAGFDENEAFVNDALAMWPDGSWMYGFLNQQEDMEIVLWPYPQLGPERGATIMWSHTLAVSSQIDESKLDATMRLIQFISDNSDQWTRNGGMPTARLSLRDEALLDEVWTLATFDEQFREEGVMEFQSDHFSEIDDAYQAEIVAALTLQKSVEQALNDAADRIEQALR